MGIKNNISLFQRMDSFLFIQIDNLKKSPFYLKIRTPISQFEEDHPSTLSNVAIATLITIPLIFALLFFASNNTLKDEIEMKKQMIESSNNILETLKNINQSTHRIFSSTQIMSVTEFNEQISALANETGADTSKIKLSNLKTDNPTPHIRLAEIDLNFTQMTTEELTNFMSALLLTKKLKISSIDISRKEADNLLTGKIHLMHYSKLNPLEATK